MASSTTSLSAPVSPAGGSGIGQSGVNRNDQIIHRIYLKTVGVLVDGRLTHGQGREGEKRKDKWVCPLHHGYTDYSSISSYLMSIFINQIYRYSNLSQPIPQKGSFLLCW
jgi:hypothetical protein